jgi:hypothetical protein
LPAGGLEVTPDVVHGFERAGQVLGVHALLRQDFVGLGVGTSAGLHQRHVGPERPTQLWRQSAAMRLQPPCREVDDAAARVALVGDGPEIREPGRGSGDFSAPGAVLYGLVCASHARDVAAIVRQPLGDFSQVRLHLGGIGAVGGQCPRQRVHWFGVIPQREKQERAFAQLLLEHSAPAQHLGLASHAKRQRRIGGQSALHDVDRLHGRARNQQCGHVVHATRGQALDERLVLRGAQHGVRVDGPRIGFSDGGPDAGACAGRGGGGGRTCSWRHAARRDRVGIRRGWPSAQPFHARRRAGYRACSRWGQPAAGGVIVFERQRRESQRAGACAALDLLAGHRVPP